MACAQFMNSGQPEGGSAVSPADLMSNARVWEENKQYSEAIDAYLKITKETTNNLDHMEEAWEKATHLAMSYVSDRVPEVVATVSQRLIEIKRFEQAAELYEGIGRYKDAIDIYVKAGMWEKARALCANMSPEYADEVEQQYIHRLKSENRVDELLESGQGQSVEAGLDALARMKQWGRVYETCQKQGRSDVLQKYQRLHLEQLAADGGYEEALETLDKYGAPPEPTHLPLYPKIAMAAMSHGNEKTVGRLKEVLSKLVAVLKERGDKALKEFERLALICDLVVLKTALKPKNAEYHAKITISLLRYAGELPGDKLFCEAGMACKAVGWLNVAFVLLNRYLDLSEAIEDQEPTSAGLDNSDFKGTEIPYDFPLPTEQCLDEDHREEVRDWVLQLSMDQKVLQSLQDFELEFVRENLRVDDTKEYFRAL